MRIHSSLLTNADFYEAARIARVDLDLTNHGSKSRTAAFNVLLRGESKRRPNQGTRRFREDSEALGYAATWDQWGVFLAVLFDRDDNRSWDPTIKMVTPYYASAEAFAAATADRFGAPEDKMTTEGYKRLFTVYSIDGDYFPTDYHGDHTFRFNGVPCEQSCTKCSAVQRWGVRAEQFIG